MQTDHNKTIFFSAYPPVVDGNPSIGMLHESLIERGFDNRQIEFKFKNLWKNRTDNIVLLFHWPSYFWDSSSQIRSWLKFFKFVLKVVFAKSLGYKLLWSAHNTLPHIVVYKTIERCSRKFIIKNFHLIINHSLNASQERYDLFGMRGKREVNAIHGHYEQIYTPGGTFSRESLGIPEKSKVIFLHANMRDYKGDAEFIDLFTKEAPSNIYMILMGKGCTNTIKKDNIKCVEGYRSNSEMADLISISDFFALPYKRITTSGAFFLAVTFKKPVIATDLPFFRQHAFPGTCLFYNSEKGSFANVIREIDAGWTPNRAGLDNMKSTYTWSNAAAEIKKAVDDIIRNS
ncbi:MAG: hypothetical protein A2X19_10570 [Bacteroidetes bacterium GWE2_39_28]|nr:MAG: hypothetical protein A2X19_10570 [Bacteroidetes bacterium GWE2_39_28]OFY13556.1 MAG: hypothetical protein A2X16_07810 [Bacteroidetes bacterium GWF2_39_10]OFZ07328.1 MAG: hypothetical protein A2322_01175 [Bacteroidetes bacterium RIFOXYB2_FULL_39_7]OFZ11716.1 MAG: hypothetical protein A2465_05815 [Bacteroidetes bacterium RIFOXYC2_FULL_39_11]HCT94892.1 hypothetical protein [Rikenellaceae bacterium]